MNLKQMQIQSAMKILELRCRNPQVWQLYMLKITKSQADIKQIVRKNCINMCYYLFYPCV